MKLLFKFVRKLNMKYVKKPQAIDAIQWDGDNFNQIVYNFQGITGIICGQKHDDTLDVHTPDGIVNAKIGDYIIGSNDDFYIYGKDDFERNYEKAK